MTREKRPVAPPSHDRPRSHEASGFLSSCLQENVVLDLFEGRVSAATRAEIENHLDGCEDCRSVVAETARSLAETNAPATSSARNERRRGNA